MPALLALLIVAAVVFFVLRSVAAPGTGRPRLGGGRSKCHGCRHAKKLFDDGTLCTYGHRETFKNSVHVANCVDREPR